MNLTENPKGRPKGKLSSIKLFVILELFPKDGSLIQAKELKQEALKRRISPNTLFHYLRTLERNLVVSKHVDASFMPPRVYYKRLTEEELFGIKAVMRKDLPLIERIWLEGKQVPLEITEPLKKSLFEKYLALLLAVLLRVGAKAKEIEDLQKRKEFIDILLELHLHPYLLMLSSLSEIEPKQWEDAFSIVEKMRQKSDSTFRDEIKKILPKKLSTLLSDLLSDFRQGKMKKFERKSERFMKLASSLKHKKRRVRTCR